MGENGVEMVRIRVKIGGMLLKRAGKVHLRRVCVRAG